MPDLSDNIETLDAAYPIALLPVRIETRFVSGRSPELLVRVYPDEIAAELGHLMTSDAAEAARQFWREGWQYADELDAWRRLVQRYPGQVAAALVDEHRPDNWTSRPSGQPTWANAPRPSSPQTATTRVLPDCWIAVGFRKGQQTLRHIGSAIVEPLALSFRRDIEEGAPELIDHDGLQVEPALRWTVDVEEAIKVGMAMRIPITSLDLAQGFDRLVVYGVKTTLSPADTGARLETLLDSHRHSRGLALVPQGTPTNNSSEGGSGYPPPDDADRRFVIERGPPLPTPGSDGDVLAKALGLATGIFDHVEGAGGVEQKRARAMNQALWPCTLGYFLEQMMAPLVSAANVTAIRSHVADFVRGRGPLPAFRVGRVPYGILPVTPLWGSIDGFETALVERLSSWQPRVLEQVPHVARIGRTGDPDADLLGILALDASTREVRLREVVGPAYVRAVLQLLDTDASLGVSERSDLTQRVMTALGMAGSPRVGTMTFSNKAPRIDLPMVAPEPLSEDQTLVDNYITDLLTAKTTEDLEPSPVSRPLLFHLLRQGALVEYHRVAVDLAIAAGLDPKGVPYAQASDRREIELFQVPPPPAGAPSPQPPRRSPSQRFAQTLPVAGGSMLSDWLLNLPTDPAKDHGRQPIRAHVEALKALEGAPTAELERLMTETLDTCSHRLDAWITSLATRRLSARRATHPEGIYLGGYAFVENLRARQAPFPGQTGGFIHAPSASHAAAAAILRNGYLTHENTAEVAIDLSSQRVRRALSLFDGVRHGQQAGAVLGYWFERGLHDRQLDRYIAPFRRLYPLGRLPDAPDEGPDEPIAARNVVNGLALRDALLRRPVLPWTDADILPLVSEADRPAVQVCLAQLEDDVDAAADLLAAESVYQAVQGNTDRAGANLASGAGTGSLPTPGIVTPPTSGTAFTHRVAIVLGGAPTTLAWPASGARRIAEPRLDAWLGNRMGSAAAVQCRARYDQTETTVTMQDLGLSAIDFVILARRTGAAGSELASRVIAHVRATVSGITGPVEVDFARPTAAVPSWPYSVFSVDEALETARLLGDLALGARPLSSDDLMLPHAAGAPFTVDTAEMTSRATAALGQLGAARSALDAAVTAAASPSPPPTSLDDLRAALWTAAGFGVREAVPVDLAGTDAVARAALRVQGATMQAELARRDAAASVAISGFDKLIALFGLEVPILVPFTPANRPDLDTALAQPPGNPIGTRHWLERMARLRDPLDRLRLAHLASDAMTGTPVSEAGLHFEIAQLPFVPGAPWIGNSFDPSEAWQRPRAGTVSIAVHRPVGFEYAGSWSGLLLDDWSETIPAASQMTSYAVHHQSPGAEAPQCVLLAVAPPTPDVPRWGPSLVEDCIEQAFDVARIRAVDSDLLHPYALLVPCIYLAANVAPDTIRSPLSHGVIHEAVIAPPE